MGKPKKQGSAPVQADPIKEQVDAITRDYIVEPRLGLTFPMGHPFFFLRASNLVYPLIIVEG